ncbi:MAG: glycogen synthase GlgA [Gammaproteobacteria bacterium HGW-Gammaproteobacteria-1]|jgi:starch synthase|nr:MAG: glycogen synthase GlgA [Gammaproteobacteria bacterium HGW-Gammaproteobacteria-1]
MSRILFACSEAHPLIKTGGLADVSGSLPPVLQALGDDVRLVLPAYRQVLQRLPQLPVAAELNLPGSAAPVRILEATLPQTDVTVWLVDAPAYFDRDGGPYLGPDGHDWPDNAARYTLFARAVVELAQDRAGLAWRPDVVHCNDWQTGLVPALLAQEPQRPGTVFTIHNMAYQGLFTRAVFDTLNLPEGLWHMEAMEFYSQFNFLKGGLVFSDWITTVSPTYAQEIRMPAFGYGLEGVLNHRAARLRGILNGVDYAIWDPAHDPLIPHHFGPTRPAGKKKNKAVLQQQFGLVAEAATPLVGLVGRMVEQKGIDLVLDALPALLEQHPLQLAVVGTGTAAFEQAFRDLAAHYPQRVGLFIGYDEGHAHLVEAGADIFLMPSRFEPCGLNQIYSLRYGTVPVVRRTGGLADTVVHADAATLADGSATGFSFEAADSAALGETLQQALELYGQPPRWRRLMVSGMRQDFSWEQSARHYQELYRQTGQ